MTCHGSIINYSTLSYGTLVQTVYKEIYIVKDTEGGGMVHIDSFAKALKVTWLRKITIQPD